MSAPIQRPLAALLAIVTVAALVASCTSDEADTTVAVVGRDEECELADTELDAGQIAFEFSNEADDVNELYVLRENGDVVGEVENVTTGTSRTLSVDLAAGEYEVRCKPGQSGDGFATSFTVTGAGGEAVATPDRELAVEAVDFTYPGLDLEGITAGETIRFEMVNDGTQQHEFEVLDPNGEAVGEVAAMDPGATGGATITFDEPGTYTYQCILVDPATDQEHTKLGMTGTFDVASG